MARKRRRKRPPARAKQAEYPGWMWMLFGLAIGLSVAFAIYVRDNEPVRAVATPEPQPASLQSAIDDNGETPPAEEEPAAERRFDFYDMLPTFEVEVDPGEGPQALTPAPTAIDEPGLYLLQAGSFSTPQDADRRKGDLAFQGIESFVQRATVNDRDYFRVYIGPIDDLEELNVTRSRLREAKIDVLRIRIGD